jgi:CRP/FNR family transcriptional regulator, transcriptional activator FtrB
MHIFEEDFDRVSHLPLLDSLDPEYCRRLLGQALNQKVGAGETLFEQGQRPDFLHILVEGAVELRGRDRDGNETVVEVVQPVECFILAAVVTDSPYLMTARTLESSRMLMIPAHHLRGELHREPSLALVLIASMARHYRDMVRQIKDLKLRTSAERVGSYLLSLAVEQGGSATVELPYLKRVLAERMGMTPENLSRAFARLRERGVQIKGSRVIIEDVEKLAAYCRVDTLVDGVEGELRVPRMEPFAGSEPDDVVLKVPAAAGQ